MTESDVVVLRSAANPTIRRLVRLRDNRRRKQSGTFLVDGWRESARAVLAGFELRGLYVPLSTVNAAHDLPAYLHSKGTTGEDLALAISLYRKARADGVLVGVQDNLVSKFAYGQSPRGVVAELVAEQRGLDALDLDDRSFVLILDSIEKPGNVGAVFRCADAAGVDAVILTGEGCDMFNPNVIRGSLGAVFSLAWATATRDQAQEFLLKHNIRTLAARVESSQDYWSTDLSRPLAIVLGNEARGLGQAWQTLGNAPIAGVKIPMLGQSDSLNVSVSAALLAFETARQNVV